MLFVFLWTVFAFPCLLLIVLEIKEIRGIRNVSVPITNREQKRSAIRKTEPAWGATDSALYKTHKQNKVRYLFIVLTYVHYSKGQQHSNVTSIRKLISSLDYLRVFMRQENTQSLLQRNKALLLTWLAKGCSSWSLWLALCADIVPCWKTPNSDTGDST